VNIEIYDISEKKFKYSAVFVVFINSERKAGCYGSKQLKLTIRFGETNFNCYMVTNNVIKLRNKAKLCYA